MSVNVLFSARPALWPVYEPLLNTGLADAGVKATIATDLPLKQAAACQRYLLNCVITDSKYAGRKYFYGVVSLDVCKR